jgi:hypothetical protein
LLLLAEAAAVLAITSTAVVAAVGLGDTEPAVHLL